MSTENNEIPFGVGPGPEFGYSDAGVGRGNGRSEATAAATKGDWKYHAMEFAKGFAEMSVEFGKGCRDVVNQNLLTKDSFFMRNIGALCLRISTRLRFLNEYLPEDRHPVHAWAVILLVSVVALAASCRNNNLPAAFGVNIGYENTASLVKQLYVHPPNASRILLPDGRHLAYHEVGVPVDRARFSIICVHPFLSSRLSGIPGIKPALLQEFGIRLVTYDLPGFGESDPHPDRNLESSAFDMLQLSYAVGVTDKFWVLAHSGGSMHAWAALRYIPDRVAGAVMVAPIVNPYTAPMTKRERSRTWATWTLRRKFMYFLARRFPSFLAYFYNRSFLYGNHGNIEKWLSSSLGERDKALVEEPVFKDFWHRDVEESVRQRKVKPFVEEAVLQVSNWGFKLSDLSAQKKHHGKGILSRLKSMCSQAPKELTGFLGPIHIWQGMDDKVVPPSIADFVQRVLPEAMVHKLLYDGHFTYFYFCNECHKQMFTTLFGNPQGPLPALVEDLVQPGTKEEKREEVVSESANAYDLDD